METRSHLSAAVRRRLQTGRVSLDFTHTGGDGPFALWEILHNPADAVESLNEAAANPPLRTEHSTSGKQTMSHGDARAACSSRSRDAIDWCGDRETKPRAGRPGR